MADPARTDAPIATPWQERLLPLMVRMLAGLTLFFFVATVVQLYYLQGRIDKAPTLTAAELAPTASDSSLARSDRLLALYRTRTAAVLENNVVARRYHQANVLLMSRVWSNYLGFVTGMILALVGAAFILGQLQTAPNELEGTTPALKLTIRTASPGITLCALGTLLMVTTIVTNHSIETRDIPVYFGKETLGAEAGKPLVNLSPDSVPGRP